MKWNAITPVAALLVLVVAAFAPMSPASTWVPRGAENASGAPAAYAGADNLGNARRAAGDASAQAGFLTQGTSKLKDGTEELRDGSGELADGISAAKDGADELSNGMIEIQAGTGQLADGATRLADNVGGAVDQVVGFDAIRGQVLSAIDDTLEGTRDSNDPDVKELRRQLEDLRKQVDTAELPEDWTDKLTELKDGSRELANQLSTPGYAYHDGIYSATNGASDLAEGLGEMDDRVGEAKDGVQKLVDGATKVDDMSNSTKDRIGDIQRALPAAAPVAGSAGAAGAGAAEGASISSSLPPLAAMLVSALAVLGGVAAALAAYGVTRSRWTILGLGVLLAAGAGTILVTILGTGLTPAAIGMTGLALALGTLASAGVTWILRGTFGELGGTATAGIFALAQTGLVGWVWSRTATGDVDTVVRALSSAMPMHWSTAAISSAGNNGSLMALWVGIGLSALLAVLGVVAMRMSRPVAVPAEDAVDADYADAGYTDADYAADDYADADYADNDDLTYAGHDDTAVLETDEAIEHRR